MKLKKLWIDKFKNLENFELNFENNDGITVLIGNNGSGKSNVLEAISAIFYDLYNIRNSNRKNINIEQYELEYFLYEKNIFIKKENNNYEIKYYLKNGFEQELNEYEIEKYLPSNIVLIYSGEDEKIKRQFYEYFRRKFQKELKNQQTIPQLPKMIYLDKFFWTIGLLVLLKQDRDFCKKILQNDNLEDISIKFELKEDLISSADIFINILLENNSSDIIDLSLDEFLEKDILLNEKDIFVYLTGNVGQNKKIKKLSIQNKGIDSINLSEGEKKQILIKVALEILADENTLILMDEPDSNIHIANKILIKDILQSYDNRETILTTHSPTLTHSFDNKHIFMLENGKIQDKQKQEIFSKITNGIWSYQEQNIFLSSQKDIILLVEGKHDKIHITEAFKRLKDEYEELDFDIFYLNGEQNIKHMILGLANNSIDFDGKKIIAIFDNDKPGQDSFNKNFKKIENKDYKALVDNNGDESNIFYGFLLPKKQSFKNFTIENMYDGNKYKEALNEALNNRNDISFYDNFIDDISKQLKEDAKNILANNCKSFDDEDFEHFRKLFDIILEIKKNY